MKNPKPNRAKPQPAGPEGRSWLLIALVAAVVIAIIASVLVMRDATGNQTGGNQSAPQTTNSGGRPGGSGRAERLDYEVVGSYPHDPAAYTQGLVWWRGGFFESTGLYGQSSLRRVEFPSGRVLQQLRIDAELFAEGLALVEGRLIQLTWTTRRGFVYDRDSFKLQQEFTYDTEGWGLAYDGKNLILSDGSSSLTLLDPKTFKRVGSLKVTMDGAPLDQLTELEFINGEIWANVWMRDIIVRIDPATGRVASYLDMTGLLPANQRRESDDVLNGIAYDPEAKRIFVGGKRWPRLFEIRLK
jgi:glutamine cyclotransferase